MLNWTTKPRSPERTDYVAYAGEQKGCVSEIVFMVLDHIEKGISGWYKTSFKGRWTRLTFKSVEDGKKSMEAKFHEHMLGKNKIHKHCGNPWCTKCYGPNPRIAGI
jgi:hypothetical protein